MSKNFMEEYYYLKYRDTFMVQAMEENEECRKLYEEIMRMEGIVEEAMQKMGKEYLQLHGELFAAKGTMDDLIMRLAYLKGAEDREKMLRS